MSLFGDKHFPKVCLGLSLRIPLLPSDPGASLTSRTPESQSLLQETTAPLVPEDRDQQVKISSRRTWQVPFVSSRFQRLVGTTQSEYSSRHKDNKLGVSLGYLVHRSDRVKMSTLSSLSHNQVERNDISSWTPTH